MQYQSVLYYRDKLAVEECAVYDSLMQQWMKMEPVITLSNGFFDISKIAQYILYDYPMLFYINYYNLRYLRSQFEIRITGDYLYAKDQARALLHQFERWGSSLVQQFPASWTQEQKAKWLHHYLTLNVSYANTGIDAHNLVGVVRDKEAVCEGIAKAYKFLCDLAGVPCIVVSGNVDGEAHGWNKIWLNGRPSFVDVTNSLPGHKFAGKFLLSVNDIRNYIWNQQLVPNIR